MKNSELPKLKDRTVFEIKLRMAEERDYNDIEFLTREAFWNVYKPGCDEHLIVHNMHKDNVQVKELELVAVSEEKIVGHIIYTKAKIRDCDKDKFLAFGPISVDISLQNKGIGSALIKESLKKATDLGYEAVFITGNPVYYNRFGFVSASKYYIHMEGVPVDDEAPFFMVVELKKGALKDVHGYGIFDERFETDKDELEEFEKKFPPKVKEVREGQL
ncbi:N-acetyltransferase [Clostridium sp. SM-530-WT-3G]|uniref:GNAT family N-acetyltransferase n=1 Tax=Clostridium sp. SM-530-WT-3G TaxID=2725303 RepID=UPI00145EA737|nr:N-acetyltransferase [Clostridium sp. SM-530-WT-3G]NME84180.1 N-acetyltransferase [Clostridium sp. SM-530-WT-3G]